MKKCRYPFNVIFELMKTTAPNPNKKNLFKYWNKVALFVFCQTLFQKKKERKILDL